MCIYVCIYIYIWYTWWLWTNFSTVPDMHIKQNHQPKPPYPTTNGPLPLPPSPGTVTADHVFQGPPQSLDARSDLLDCWNVLTKELQAVFFQDAVPICLIFNSVTSMYDTCIYIYTYIYIYIYTVYVYIYIYGVCMYIYIYTYIYIYIYVWCMYVYIWCMYIYIYMVYMYIYIYICIYIHIHIICVYIIIIIILLLLFTVIHHHTISPRATRLTMQVGCRGSCHFYWTW